jgi:alpha-mannosidase
LLASRKSCNGRGNWYLQAGDHHFTFHIGASPPGRLERAITGIGNNVPFFPVLKDRSSDNRVLPESMSFVTVSEPNILLSTLKKAENDDNLIIRAYDLAGKDTRVHFRFHFPITGAQKVNMIEQGGVPVSFSENGFDTRMGHHSIETFKINGL